MSDGTYSARFVAQHEFLGLFPGAFCRVKGVEYFWGGEAGRRGRVPFAEGIR